MSLAKFCSSEKLSWTVLEVGGAELDCLQTRKRTCGLSPVLELAFFSIT